MAKGKKTKKKNWKLRRQLRKTFGCLFMISALIVTAIPVQPNEAAVNGGWTEDRENYKTKYWVYSKNTTIPTISKDNTPVYQDQTGNFRFVYVNRTGDWEAADMEKFAVVVDYEREQNLDGGKLTIPSTMDAYIKYTDTATGGGGSGTPGEASAYAAASKNGKPLFYKVETTRMEEVQGDPVLTSEDLNGDGKFNDYIYPVETREVRASVRFAPCTKDSKDIWSPNGVDVPLYYFNGTGTPTEADKIDETKWTQVQGVNDGRITEANVKYIGNQYAQEKDGQWKLYPSTTKRSVFGGEDEGAAAANISELTIGNNLLGVGDYAFLGCTNLKGIKFGNGLNTLGNYSFADCRQLTTVTMDPNTMINVLGAGAFANCDLLQSIELPVALEAIGDFCFKNCKSLTKVVMTTDEKNGLGCNLKRIGYRAFENCSSLEELTLPASYNGAEGTAGGKDTANSNNFHLSTVNGCTSLKYIKTFSTTLNFVSDASGGGTVDGNYGIEEFKKEVGESFYFEGPGYTSNSGSVKTPVHNMANVNHICFKYLNDDRYEIVEDGLGYDRDPSTLDGVGLVFQVNKAGNLIKFQIEDLDGNIVNKHVPEINMPDQVGPVGILGIEAGSFNNNCYIEKIVIPKSVETIGPGAFQGSHNLKHIVFNDATKINSIGANAFATQVIDDIAHNGTRNTCTDTTFLSPAAKPFLSFTGAIEKDDGTNTEPFKYAMKATSKINAGEQRLAYITYYSGMPTNLTVRYNPGSADRPETAGAELLHFPTMEDLKNGFKVDANYEGAYKPVGSTSSTLYRYPYMSQELEQEVTGAGTGSGSSENQVNMVNSVENIVIPTGVTRIKEGLFSGLTVSGNTITAPVRHPMPSDLYDSDDPDDPNKIPYEAPAKDIKTLTTKSIMNIDPYTFGWMPELTKAYISGAASIGNYAFDECPKLEYAEIGSDTATLGLRPFSGCDILSEVKFNSNPYFTAETGVIYGIDGSGTKTKIVQCLPGRGNPSIVGSMGVGPDELNGIKEIAPEAFMDCPNIREVDLSTSVVTTIPERCFAESRNLNNVILPNTIKTIQNGSFWNTDSLYQVMIPDSIASIANDAFAKVPRNEDGSYGKPKADRNPFNFVTTLGSNADEYASLYDYITVKENADMRGSIEIPLMDAVDPSNPKQYDVKRILKGDNLELTILDIPDHTAEGYRFSHWQPDPKDINPILVPMPIWAMYEKIGANMYTVRFFDINKEEMKEYTQQVEEGKDAVPPSRDAMAVDGKVFIGWDRAYTEIKGNVDIYAQYSDRTEGMYYVTFYTDSDLKTVIGKTQEVKEGESAIEPAHPTKEGYTFSAWSSDGWKNVTRDWDIFAVYTQGGSKDPDDPNNPDNPNNPDDPNKPGNSDGDGSNNDKDKDKDKDKDSVSENATKYKVTVNGGSGSGDYTAGTIVPINAYARADGTVFDKWTSSSNGVGFVNQTAISTTFTMPANNVEITANFKNDTSSVSSNSRSARRNSTTTVDVNKSGISNTGLASANVNGSSDNYVVRITDDAQATAAVIAALEGKYGNLNNIAYLPMDISLYDSTGQTKITDVSGISVDITLPLPDGLIQYAGNNRAASVVNGRLEDLATKFTTIDGVPCVQFTATHFSPYTIYVDKGNLTEGLIDATPKTGDPIHPKWFLAMGLACISIILFCKKDKKQPKVKAA